MDGGGSVGPESGWCGCTDGHAGDQQCASAAGPGSAPRYPAISNFFWTRQTQSIESRFLPTLPDTAVPFAKKADVALTFKPYHDRVRSSLEAVRRKRPGMTLSQMSDAYTSSVVLGCGIEIKESGGDYNEAVVQLGIWCSAGLQKTQEMRIADTSLPHKPLLGWTIIGLEWRLHISWRDDKTGDVVSHFQSSCVYVG